MRRTLRVRSRRRRARRDDARQRALRRRDPVGAYIARPAGVERAFAKAPLVHTSTFGGKRAGVRRRARRARRARRRRAGRQARERGEQLLAGARAIARSYPAVDRATCAASGCSSASSSRTKAMAAAIIPEMLKRGVTAAWTLNQQRVIRLEPPLIVTASEIDRALAALREAVAAALRAARTLLRVTRCRTSKADRDRRARRAVYELAKDQERFPQFMPDVEIGDDRRAHARRRRSRAGRR